MAHNFFKDKGGRLTPPPPVRVHFKPGRNFYSYVDPDSKKSGLYDSCKHKILIVEIFWQFSEAGHYCKPW